jgi:hypothetical protein
MRKILTVEERIEFYKGVTERLVERMKSYALYADEEEEEHSSECDNDYDGGRYDFYTTRGLTK